jgi:hypothetical protein
VTVTEPSWMKRRKKRPSFEKRSGLPIAIGWWWGWSYIDVASRTGTATYEPISVDIRMIYVAVAGYAESIGNHVISQACPPEPIPSIHNILADDLTLLNRS